MPKITKLDSSSPEFEKVKKKLFRYWISIIKNEKKNKKKKIIMFPTPISVHVFRVINKEVATAFWEKVKKIEKKGKAHKRKLFHGTTRCKSCKLHKEKLCSSGCNLCSIISSGYSINIASTKGYLGQGIYFAKSASKSHNYTDHGIYTKTEREKGRNYVHHALLLNAVNLGRIKVVHKKQDKLRPEHKFDSIKLKKNEEKFRKEYCVFENKQASPCYVVFYEFPKSS